MAKENIEISDKVKKCKILLLDIEGTTTSISFVKDKLFPYAEDNVKVFLESHWEEEAVKEAVAALRKQAAEDQEKSVEGAVVIPAEDAVKDEQIEGLVKNVKWQMAADRKAGPLKQLQGLIWKQGYDNGDIKGHVYDDVSPALELWRSAEGQKVYIYSSGSVQAQKLLFAKSSAGDMLPLIDGHFDTAVGAKQEAASYAAIAEKIGAKPEEILFLTDIVKEAEAAVASGLQAALLSREGNAPLPADAAASFPVLHSFDQLASTNKRKPEPQVEEVPAKVPKTDIQDDVKTASETEVEAVANTNGNAVLAEVMETAAEKTDEKMEVEETMDVEESLPKDSVVTANVEENIAEKDVPMAEAIETVPPVVDAHVKVTANAESTVANMATPPVTEASVHTVDDTNIENPVEESVVSAQTAKTKAEEKLSEPKTVETLPIKAEPLKTITESKSAEKQTIEPLIAESKTVDEPITDSKTDIPVDTADAVTSTVEADIEVSKSVNIPAASTVEISSTEPNSIDATESEKVEAPSVEITETVTETKTKDTPRVDFTAETVAIEVAESKAVEDTSVANTKEADSVTNAVITEAPKVEERPVQDISEADAVVAKTEKPITDAPKPVTPPVTTEAVMEDVTNQEVDTPVNKSEPIMEENGKKTESIETDEMDTDDTDLKNVGIVIEPKEESAPVTTKNMSTILTEVQDITDDKQSLSEVTGDLDDLVPIVEEPSPLEEMEELQNAGDVLQDAADVLEKECDEILSKVHNVTSLDYIPIKQLHTIAEEMETENIDSNDIVERILDTEMELSMKSCEHININTVQGIAEPKIDEAKPIETVTEKPTEMPNVAESAGEKMEEEVSSSTGTSENRQIKHKEESRGNNEAEADLAEEKMEVAEASAPEQKVGSEVNTKPEESKTEADIPTTDPAHQPEETAAKPENKEAENAIATQNKTKDTTSQDAKKETSATDTKVNGNATNGDATVKLNGDANKDELQSRLAVENGKEKVNGANGESVEAESGQGDNKIETERPDIKVKTVDEPRATPTEQPVEA